MNLTQYLLPTLHAKSRDVYGHNSTRHANFSKKIMTKNRRGRDFFPMNARRSVFVDSFCHVSGCGFNECALEAGIDSLCHFTFQHRNETLESSIFVRAVSMSAGLIQLLRSALILMIMLQCQFCRRLHGLCACVCNRWRI
jgi:hypothetical protein